MRKSNLFFAAAMVLCLPVAATRADPLPATDSTAIAARDLGPSAEATPAPAIAPPSSRIAEVSADPQRNGETQAAKSDANEHAVKVVVPPHRPVTHRARLDCYGPRQSARVSKHAGPVGFAVSRAPMWRAAASEAACSAPRCWKFVLLGVGY